jgi:hypothetical protein
VELHAAGILAALAIAVLAAHCAGGAAIVALAVSVVLASAAFAWAGVPDVSVLAFCVAAALAVALLRPRWLVLPAAAGICTAAWISILHGQGLPWLPAALVAISVAAAAAGLALRRAGFVSADIRDEAVVLVLCFALLLAFGPDVVDGWRAATALASEPLSAGGTDVGPWLAALVVGCLLLGGMYSLWKRR